MNDMTHKTAGSTENTTGSTSLAILDTASGIALAGDDTEMYREILKAFTESRETMQEKLENYLKSGDMDTYSIKAHGLKGNARLTGAAKLAEKAYIHETRSKLNDITFIREDFPSLIEVWNEASEYALKYISD